MWWVIFIIIYFIIGKIVVNILFENDLIDYIFEDISWIITIFFPLVLLFVFLNWIAKGISDLFY